MSADSSLIVQNDQQFQAVVAAWAASFQDGAPVVTIDNRRYQTADIQAQLTDYVAKTGYRAADTDRFHSVRPTRGKERLRARWAAARPERTVLLEGWKELYRTTRSAQIAAGQQFPSDAAIGGRLLERVGTLHALTRRDFRKLQGFAFPDINALRSNIEREVATAHAERQIDQSVDTLDAEWLAVSSLYSSGADPDEMVAALPFEGASRARSLPPSATVDPVAESPSVNGLYSGKIADGEVRAPSITKRGLAKVVAVTAAVVVLVGVVIPAIGSAARERTEERRQDRLRAEARSVASAYKADVNRHVSLGGRPGGEYRLRISREQDGSLRLRGSVSTAIGPVDTSFVRLEQPDGGAVESSAPKIPTVSTGPLRVDVANVEDGGRYTPPRHATLKVTDLSIAQDPQCETLVTLTVAGERNPIGFVPGQPETVNDQRAGVCLPGL